MSRRLRNSATGTTIIDQIGAPIADDGVRVLRRKSIKTSSEQDSSLLPRKKTRLNIEIDQNQNSVYSTPNEQNSSHISLNGNERGLNSPEHKTSIIRRMEMMYQQEFGNITDRLNIKTPIKCFMNQAHCARSHLFNMVSYKTEFIYCFVCRIYNNSKECSFVVFFIITIGNWLLYFI